MSNEISATVNSRKERIKMSLVVLLPVSVVVILTSLALHEATNDSTSVGEATSNLQDSLRVEAVILSLQLERGMTAMFLSSEGKNYGAFKHMIKIHKGTDSAFSALTNYEYDLKVLGNFTSLSSITEAIEIHRNKAENLDISVENNIKYYTGFIKEFLRLDMAILRFPLDDEVWRFFVTKRTLLRLSDSLGINRALGSTFFTQCKFIDSNSDWFLSNEAKVELLFSLTNFYCKECESWMSNHLNPIKSKVTKMRNEIIFNSTWSNSTCLNFTSDQKYNFTQNWFDDLTKYIVAVSDLRKLLVDKVLSHFKMKITDSNTVVVSYLCTLIFVVISSVGIGAMFIRSTGNILQFVSDVAQQLTFKSENIELQRKETDVILRQMLPEAVIQSLKYKKDIPAEYFESATVFFSEIVDFDMIVNHRTPMDVVTLLNASYRNLDAIIDNYHVYKVETIKDSYMIVGGVPEPRPDHLTEVAKMALAMLCAVDSISVSISPSGFSQTLQILAGIHYGPVVAGVVGTKMPRYCLFGDTVNTASRMKSTSEAMKVQISEQTADKLDLTLFAIEERGSVHVKGKGLLKTFWLSGYAEQCHSAVLTPE